MRLARWIGIWTLGLASVPAMAAGAEDGVDLSVVWLGGDAVELQWTGGTDPFQVFRSDDPALIEDPIRKQGDTASLTWDDDEASAGVIYYRVAIDPEPGRLKGITRLHNDVRGAVPVEMPPLVWDPDVAAIAQAWADNCAFGHNSGRGNLGENIAAFYPGGSSTAASVVNNWAAEASCYDVTTNSCDSACQSCLHYTQIVWSTTLRVGCGVANCPTNSPFGLNPWDFWVCDYDPPGNWVGQTPY